MSQPHARIKNLGRNFGVLEIILSVAILAAFSVFVLKLFVLASNYEKNMRLLDKATYSAVTIIEQFKNGNEPFAINSHYGGTAKNDVYACSTQLSNELRADISIKKGNQNLAGGTYQIDVNIKNSSGKKIYELNGAKYFLNGKV